LATNAVPADPIPIAPVVPARKYPFVAHTELLRAAHNGLMIYN